MSANVNADVRRCLHCGSLIAPTMRKHTKYCTPQCRALAYYYRKEYGSERA